MIPFVLQIVPTPACINHFLLWPSVICTTNTLLLQGNLLILHGQRGFFMRTTWLDEWASYMHLQDRFIKRNGGVTSLSPEQLAKVKKSFFIFYYFQNQQLLCIKLSNHLYSIVSKEVPMRMRWLKRKCKTTWGSGWPLVRTSRAILFHCCCMRRRFLVLIISQISQLLISAMIVRYDFLLQ